MWPWKGLNRSPTTTTSRAQRLPELLSNFIDSPTNSAESVVVVFRKIQCQAHLHFHSIGYQSLSRTPSGSENTRCALYSGEPALLSLLEYHHDTSSNQRLIIHFPCEGATDGDGCRSWTWPNNILSLPCLRLEQLLSIRTCNGQNSYIRIVHHQLI